MSVTSAKSRRWWSFDARYKIGVCIFLGVLGSAAAIYGALKYAGLDRERDLQAWQSRLGIVADSRAAAIDSWLQNQFEGLTQIAGNTALQLYFTQMAVASPQTDRTDTDVARAGYLKNLLTVIAHRMGFDQPPDGPKVAANVPRTGAAGIALIAMDGRVLTATDGMPPLNRQIQSGQSGETAGPPRLLDLYLDNTGTYSIGFVVPIFAIQAENNSKGQVGWVVGVKRAADELYPLLKQPGAVWRTAETVLVRRVDAGIEYLSPTRAADDRPGRILAADTPRLAAAYALEKPGGFAILRDYQGTDVLFSARKIRAAPWVLYYKIDRDEALGASDTRVRRLLIWMLTTILAVIAIVIAAWRYGTSVRAAEAAARAETLSRRYEAQSEFLKLITDSQPAAMFIVDQEDRYKFANRVAAEVAGIGEEDLIGKPLASVLGPAAARRYVALNSQVRDSGERRTDVHQTGSNGDLRVVQSEHIPIAHDGVDDVARPQSGARRGILVVEDDITLAVAEKERRVRTLQQLVQTLMAIIDRRDPHAAHHSARVAEMARAIALEMGLDEDLANTAGIAGQLMNLGKVLVPSEMLTRDGLLAENEKRLVRDSLQHGADLLEGIEFDGPVVQTLRQIQERWDGTGAPSGLAGDDILITAQIVAAANAFVALTSERAWRSGTNYQTAADELMKEAGGAFARRVVSALINLVDNRDLPSPPASETLPVAS